MTEVNELQIENNYDHLTTEEKNNQTVYCMKCPSKILSPTFGKLTKIEVTFYIDNCSNQNII